MQKLCLALLLLMFVGSATALAQSVTGRWKTISDENGETKSVVEIYKKGGKVYGKVVKVLDPTPEFTHCTKCPEDDDRHGERIVGMEIIRGLEQDGDEWEDGTILDPSKGKVYDCSIWREGKKLKVRGYWGLFYRTQTWLPVD